MLWEEELSVRLFVGQESPDSHNARDPDSIREQVIAGDPSFSRMWAWIQILN